MKKDTSFKKKGSGILLHVSSLPSDYGVGDFGPAAYRFVDFLAKAGQKYWQVLPINPTDSITGNSPYCSCSAFATDPLFISPELLLKEGLLERADLAAIIDIAPDTVNYETARKTKTVMFEKAYARFIQNPKKLSGYGDFCRSHAEWLDDFAVYTVIKRDICQSAWNQWPEDIRMRHVTALQKIHHEHVKEIEQVKFLQYLAFSQWMALKEYANKKGVSLIGDIPIYVSGDSADVWKYPYLFKLDDAGNPIFVAGVPPDYFSQTGQRWGNPVYDWELLEQTGYAWWLARIGHNLKLYDYVRIDHFRGLVAFWQIPASEPTAINGTWEPVPTIDFMQTIKEAFGHIPIIAEDLGIITPDVVEIMDQFDLPGMKVLVFAFNGDMETHPYLPHNFKKPCVVYTGTHDNNTVMGWFQNEATAEEKEHLADYISEKVSPKKVHWILIDLALESPAVMAIIPMQDVLGLGAKQRMNRPGTVGGNWEWRLTRDQITSSIVKHLYEITRKSGRIS